MIRSLALILVFVAPPPARAVLLDDLLSGGYIVMAATKLPGSFNGCVPQHRLVFGDGSVFACARTQAQTAYEPRIYILRLGAGPPSVVLAGSTVLAGQLLRLKLHDYPVPLRMNADPLPDRHALPSTALQPIGAIPPIDTANGQLHALLEQQQAFRPGTIVVRRQR